MPTHQTFASDVYAFACVCLEVTLPYLNANKYAYVMPVIHM